MCMYEKYISNSPVENCLPLLENILTSLMPSYLLACVEYSVMTVSYTHLDVYKRQHTHTHTHTHMEMFTHFMPL